MFRAVGVEGWWVVLATRVGGNEWYLEGMRNFCYSTADILNFRQSGLCYCQHPINNP